MSEGSNAIKALDKTIVGESPWTPPEDSGHIPFGDWLVRRGVISRVHLFRALNYSFLGRCRIGEAVVAIGLAPQARIEEEARSHAAFIRFIRDK